MSNDAIVSYLDTETQNSESPSQSLAERLSNALRKYQLNSEIQGLNVAYSHHLAHEEMLKINKLNIQGLIKAFGTFNIAPSGSYEHYLSVINNKSDLEAVHSDWKMVGEDLSFASIKYLIENRKSDG